jgi:hypothetical protein
MDMILLDWTRMGRTYCVTGAVHVNGLLRILRPLPRSQRDAPVRNTGWSPFQLDGHSRWEMFEVIAPEPATPQAPHLEDAWVISLRSRRGLAAPAQRRAVLQATLVPEGQLLFGVPLRKDKQKGYLLPSEGLRSLTSLAVRQQQIELFVERTVYKPDATYRVRLHVKDLDDLIIPFKDHFLLNSAERASPTDTGRLQALKFALAQMGETVIVRLGVSRPYAFEGSSRLPVCWLMADGFFSAQDPQP